jgi:hypothetical protein
VRFDAFATPETARRRRWIQRRAGGAVNAIETVCDPPLSVAVTLAL